jgi:hypothetical protein
MAQGFEYVLAVSGMPRIDAAALFDAVARSAVGLTLTVAFLGGTLVGVVLLVIALWRSRRMPIGALVLLLVFPLVDLALPAQPGPVISHLVLLASFVWIAAALLRREPVRRARSALRPTLPARA